jgi:hypothetical protein
MTKTTEQLYLEWLKAQIWLDHPSKKYDGLMDLLYNREFVWIIANDDNRVQDSLNLRVEFDALLESRGSNRSLQNGLSFLEQPPVSVLEILVGLSRRLEFSADGEANKWAWQLLMNLELHRFDDPLGIVERTRIDEILDGLIWRTYKRDGQGGFFPLAWPTKDQTKVELWYQMNAYIDEIPNH